MSNKIFNIDEKTGELHQGYWPPVEFSTTKCVDPARDLRRMEMIQRLGEAMDRHVASTAAESRHVSTTGAIRDNKAKVDYSLVPLDLLDGCARVFKIGETKYGRWNFRKGFEPSNTLGSVFRHLMEVQRAIELGDREGDLGHLLDAETGEGHAHHLLCSVLIMLDSLRRDGFKV